MGNFATFGFDRSYSIEHPESFLVQSIYLNIHCHNFPCGYMVTRNGDSPVIFFSFYPGIISLTMLNLICYLFFRGKPASSVSKSVGVLDLSGKDKSAKPPRRLSVPAKSLVTSAAKPAANITPISEARTKRSTNNQGKIETPLSDVSRTSNRKKFNMLSSASYWLSQIKLSESAVKHSISLGFFKLALEAGCEVWQLSSFTFFSFVSLLVLSLSRCQ